MSFYQVDSNQLRTKKDELSSLIQRFIQEKESLCGNEVALRGMWEGEANDAFHAEFMRSAGRMDTFVRVIDQYVNVIESVAGRYDLAEQNNMGRVM